MSVQVSWLIYNRVIYWHCKDNCSILDLQKAEVDTLLLAKECQPDEYHIVFDLQDVKEFPSIPEMMGIQWILPRQHKNGWKIFVGLKNPLHKLFIGTTGKLSKSQVRVVSTHKEAFTHLTQYDSTIPDLSRFRTPLALLARR